MWTTRVPGVRGYFREDHARTTLPGTWLDVGHVKGASNLEMMIPDHFDMDIWPKAVPGVRDYIRVDPSRTSLAVSGPM